MSIAAAIEAMRAKGIADSDILDIVAHMASAEVVTAPARTARQERNARYYASKKRLKASETSESDASDLPLQKKVSPNPSKKTTPSISEAALPRSERKHAWPDDFAEQVWSLFPKHVEKKAGIEALKAVHRSDKLDWEVLTAAIRSLAATCEPKFVPALHRWLRGERWNDQRPEQRPGAGPPQRRTFSQIARESAAELGQIDERHRQADDFRGTTLDLVVSGPGEDQRHLRPHRAGGRSW